MGAPVARSCRENPRDPLCVLPTHQALRRQDSAIGQKRTGGCWGSAWGRWGGTNLGFIADSILIVMLKRSELYPNACIFVHVNYATTKLLLHGEDWL